MDLNKAMLIGRLTRDPDLKTTPSGQSVANFAIATNRAWTGPSGNKQSSVEYHNIVVWGKLANICSQYLHKGKKVYVEGRLQTREWEAQDGNKRRTTEIVVSDMIMLDSMRGGASQPARPATPAATPATPSQPQESGQPVYEPVAETGTKKDNSEEVKIEDIPF